jgi:hypothetical protein
VDSIAGVVPPPTPAVDPVPDTLAAPDTLPADAGAPVPAGDERAPPVLRPLQGPTPGVDEGTGRLLPAPRIVALLMSPLEPEVEYTLTAAGIRNLAGLGGGGGQSTVTLEAPEADTVPSDTLAQPDTGAVDTIGAARR